MLDTKLLRENFDSTKEALLKRGFHLEKNVFQSLDGNRKLLQVEVESLQSARNKLSSEFGEKKKSGESTDHLKKQVDEINLSLKTKEEELNKLTLELNDFLMGIPNIPDESVPVGKDENENVVIEQFGEILTSNKLDHLEISEEIDTEMAAKLAGSRFAVLKGDMAKLQRALISFMLDNAIKNGYQEYYVPFMANEDSLIGTGQLPKFEEDLFRTSEKLFLIPTAEVPLTNIFRNEFIDHKDLPIKVTSHTPCFRSEAGSYGKDTRGLIRQHQFEKIELVQITNPDESMACLDSLLSNACEVLDLLDLPYQIIELCSGDLGFSSCKTFDIEVWMPSQNKYREISSCSNFSDFQARRANIKFKNDGKNQFVHTINGSGLAVGRTLIALIENNYDGKNKVVIPKSLVPYFGSEFLLVN
tara:strand:+ start:364 stop:1611 length:1248 start_codon:yes stop_codon:yes gene_type:complete